MMKRVLVMGMLGILFFAACERSREWKTIKYYPTGEELINQAFYVDEGDTVYTYQKILYKDGALQMEGSLLDGKREGTWKSYFPDGSVWSETTFRAGVTNGPTLTNYSNGRLRYKGQYTDGEASGEWVWYDSLGGLNEQKNFDLIMGN
jgi:antitoxin component YwqK of YwqJK toxin-antitoxin module